jgi:hypothetical protein
MSAAIVKAGWDDLARECDAWEAAGRTVELWWRDDDAVSDTPALRRLLGLAAGRAPIALAVIPAALQADLAPALAREGGAVAVLQHGYDHRNRANPGSKKSEFPPERAAAEVQAALAAGRDRLKAEFGPRFVPILTPPWNRFDACHLSLLPGLGYRGISTYLARRQVEAAPGVLRLNTQVDIIDWRADAAGPIRPPCRPFLGQERALGLLVGHLTAKRGGMADPAEATGVLTHHLVHDTETWEFLGEFLDWCAQRPGIAWRSAADLFPEFVA